MTRCIHYRREPSGQPTPLRQVFFPWKVRQPWTLRNATDLRCLRYVRRSGSGFVSLIMRQLLDPVARKVAEFCCEPVQLTLLSRLPPPERPRPPRCSHRHHQATRQTHQASTITVVPVASATTPCHSACFNMPPWVSPSGRACLSVGLMRCQRQSVSKILSA